jgi:hypothetical protein
MKQCKTTLANIDTEWKYPATCTKKIWKLRTNPNDPCFNPKCPGFIGSDWSPMKSKDGYMYCASCFEKASVKVDSFLEHSHLKLPVAIKIAFELLSNYAGISASKISREYKIAPDTALRYLHLIRDAMGYCLPQKFEKAWIEVDEYYVKVGNLGLTRSFDKLRGEGTLKVPVIGIIQRNGAALLKKVITVDGPTIKKIFDDHVDKSCKIFTDEKPVYKFLKAAGYDHEYVNHKEKEFVRGSASTNNVEALNNRFNSILETYGNVKDDKLQFYCNEVAFKHTYSRLQDYGFSILMENLKPLSIHYNQGKYNR